MTKESLPLGVGMSAWRGRFRLPVGSTCPKGGIVPVLDAKPIEPAGMGHLETRPGWIERASAPSATLPGALLGSHGSDDSRSRALSSVPDCCLLSLAPRQTVPRMPEGRCRDLSTTVF
jgi:hypothetical protein